MRKLEAIVLASASPRRYDLLASLGLSVRVLPSEIEEPLHPDMTPERLAAFHASAKAQAVAPRVPDALLIAADTVVDLDGEALGKPRDTSEAIATLRRLSGRTHLVHTALVALAPANGRRLRLSSTARVSFAVLSDSQIREYVATGEPLDKAGSYGIQGRGAALVARIEGDFHTVMGLPLGSFVRSLPSFGYRLPKQSVVARLETT